MSGSTDEGKITAFRETLKQLALNTTLHGTRHLAEERRHWLEKAVWIIALATAMWGMLTSIIDVHKEYLESPVVTSFVTSQYRVWNIPFPAVAVCNVNKVSKRKALALAEELLKRGDINLSKEKITQLLSNLGYLYASDFASIMDVEDLNDETVSNIQDLNYLLGQLTENDFTLLEKVTPSCSDLLKQCLWKGREQSCEKLFVPMKTLYGLCCVFNNAHGVNETLNPPLVQSLHSPGYRTGLSIKIEADVEDYHHSMIPTSGAQILIFKTPNYPDNMDGMIEYIVSRGRELFLTVYPFSQYASNELRHFSPSERGCYFAEETHTLYTASNCLSACKMGVIQKTCDCIPHFAHNASNFKVCDLTDIPCLARNQEKFMDDFAEDYSVLWSTSCTKCLPPCTDTWYDVQSSFAQILPNAGKLGKTNGMEVHENNSLIHIYYQNLDSTLYKQDILYTRTELVSNFGGVCSLFNGFSFLSLVEIVYFLTMRWFFEIKDRTEQKSRSVSPYWNEFLSQQPPFSIMDGQFETVGAW